MTNAKLGEVVEGKGRQKGKEACSTMRSNCLLTKNY
jgi:hypothetical protein